MYAQKLLILAIAISVSATGLLHGCQSTPVPQAQLTRDELTRWLESLNRESAQIATGTDAGSRSDILNTVFGNVVEKAEDQPGEAAQVVREWRTRSGNIPTLFDYFLTRGFVLNYLFFDYGSTLFIPTERDRLGLTLADAALGELFGREFKFINPWMVNDANFVPGITYATTPIVNAARAEQLHQIIEEQLTVRKDLMPTLSPGNVTQIIAANEVAHATLVSRYDFTVESAFDRDTMLKDLPGLRIRNARQAHEFISDAASLATHPSALYALTSIFLASARVTDTGEMQLAAEHPYAASAAFFVNSVTTVLNRLGRPPDFADAVERWHGAADADKRLWISADLATRLLSDLGNRGMQSLVADYTDYATRLIRAIAATSPAN